MNDDVSAYALFIAERDDATTAFLVALHLGVPRRIGMPHRPDNHPYDVWVDRFRPGEVTVFPPLPAEGTPLPALKVPLDGDLVKNGRMSFRAFRTLEAAIDCCRWLIPDAGIVREFVDDGTVIEHPL
ncbi:hypothetical protein L0Y59_04020 [Candidatus Uhrbacteria bacterium]|nr:hypothetical protein [Candidatus Uhrbacteria bacterium]